MVGDKKETGGGAGVVVEIIYFCFKQREREGKKHNKYKDKQ